MIIKTNKGKQGSIINAINNVNDLKKEIEYGNKILLSVYNVEILKFKTEYEKLYSTENIEQYFMIEFSLDNNDIIRTYIETRKNNNIDVIHIQDLDVKYSEQEKLLIKTFVKENLK